MKIKDVIHGEIEINEPIILNLIETIEFQRLRKIKQLGVTNINFPGAEHTRYAHSLGVYEITKKILNNFKKQNEIFFTNEEEESIKIAALLHDIGHGPLSHSFESFFKLKHEELTIKIIENSNTEINKILKKHEQEKNSDLINTVTSLIKKTYKNKALVSIISSSIDADRMDYLLRDSYYSGAVYGNIDIERIIAYMQYKDGQIVFSPKGIHTLEDFILARYHMFVQIYLNQKSLIYEELIQKILNRVFKLHKQNYVFKSNIDLFLKLNKKEIKIEDYINANDYNFLSLLSDLKHEEDYLLRDLCYFLETKQIFYKEISKEDFYNIEDDKKLKTIFVNKKVYSEHETIQIKENEIIKNIEQRSQIFYFCKETLTINIAERYYEIKGISEK